jgi:hypothetical protein
MKSVASIHVARLSPGGKEIVELASLVPGEAEVGLFDAILHPDPLAFDECVEHARTHPLTLNCVTFITNGARGFVTLAPFVSSFSLSLYSVKSTVTVIPQRRRESPSSTRILAV